VYSYASRLDKLLDRELLVIGDFILTEVLQGFAEIAIHAVENHRALLGSA
jgi:hypothetical protein